MATPAQQWRELGRLEGRAEVISLGAADALTRAVLRALSRRFGPVSPETEARVRATPTTDLDDLFDRAITAPSLEAVFDDTTPD